MEKLFFLFIMITTIIAGCGPSAEEQTIQKAIADTATAASWTKTPTVTLTPTKTPIPTKIPTLVPKENNYILETGVCIILFGQKITGNPRNSPECSISSRKTISLLPNMGITMTSDPGSSSMQMFCSLYKTNGTLIMTDLDADGSGKVQCYP